MKLVFKDDREIRANLLPLTYTRPVAALRLGILTITQKWQKMLENSGVESNSIDIYYNSVDYLSVKYPSLPETLWDNDTYVIKSNILPTPQTVKALVSLANGQEIHTEKHGLVAMRPGNCDSKCESIELAEGMVDGLEKVTDIFTLNFKAVTDDYALLNGGDSLEPSPTVNIIGPKEGVYIHPKAKNVEGCNLNTSNGPIYIGEDVEVMEGSCLRGPLALCKGSTVNMGTRIYGGTTIGPHCKVGGELNNVVMMGYSNKAHDGFLGNAVVGYWCNIGAGATASNLKNDYTEIKLWNYPSKRFVRTGLQFCGAIMGDHTKLGINTMLNTATVLGVGVNIHGSGFPRPFLASFCEGGPAGYSEVSMPKFFETARKVMARRGVELTQADIDILTTVRDLAESYR